LNGFNRSNDNDRVTAGDEAWRFDLGAQEPGASEWLAVNGTWISIVSRMLLKLSGHSTDTYAETH
jgi:hypothetical protein